MAPSRPHGKHAPFVGDKRNPVFAQLFAITLALTTGLVTSTCGGDSPSAPPPTTPAPPSPPPPPPPPPPNTAPAVAIPIPDVTLERNLPRTFSLTLYFSDPDRDRLTYAATTRDPLTVGVSVTGSEVTLTPLRDGSTTVTVTARDPGGLSASQTFTATVGDANQPPTAVGTIPHQTLTRGGSSVTLDLAPRFSDPDGDQLRFEATSRDSGVVRALVSENDLILLPVAMGTATVTVTATDPDGLSATQTFGVTVGTANRPPVAVGEVPGQSLAVGGSAVTLDVSANFSDPDGDALTYAATSNDSGVVRVLVSGTEVILLPEAVGTAKVTVTATDPGGFSATQTFAVTVGTANRAPLAVAEIPDQSLSAGGSAVTLDLSLQFTDPDGDSLTYTATSSDSGVVRAIISENQLVLIPGFMGTAGITVVATDPQGMSADLRFLVTVSDVSSAVPAIPAGLRVVDVGTDFIEWSWDAVENATSYEVQFSTDEAFTAVDDIVPVDGTSYRAEGLGSGTSGHLRVRAVGGSLEDPITSGWTIHVTGMTTGAVGGVDDHGDTEGTATPVRVPSSTGGELETAGDVDYFSFELESSGTLTVYTTGPTDTVGVLTGPNGLREDNDDSGDGRNFSIVVSGADPGTYHVAVRGYVGTTLGDYELHTEFSRDGGPGTSPGDHPFEVSVTRCYAEDPGGPQESGTIYGTVEFTVTATRNVTRRWWVRVWLEGYITDSRGRTIYSPKSYVHGQFLNIAYVDAGWTKSYVETRGWGGMVAFRPTGHCGVDFEDARGGFRLGSGAGEESGSSARGSAWRGYDDADGECFAAEDRAAGQRRGLPGVCEEVGEGVGDRGSDRGRGGALRPQPAEEAVERRVGASGGLRGSHRSTEGWPDADGVQGGARGGSGEWRDRGGHGPAREPGGHQDAA